MRVDRDTNYLDIALVVSDRATCLRRRFGAVLVKDNTIVSTGYNGAPRGCEDCLTRGWCERERLDVPAGERYELCRSVHAEMNALLHAGRERAVGSVLYIAGRDVQTGEIIAAQPCTMCARVIMNAGVKEVVIRTPDGLTRYEVDEWRTSDRFWIDPAIARGEHSAVSDSGSR
jgi:dCMP deaminase